MRAADSKTGRPQVKAGGKGTQGGSGTLAYRLGWHPGKIPYALQFNRKNPVTGERDLFPADFVWAEVEYAADQNYQEEAMSYGVNKNGKFQHSLAGLPRIPEDGYYEYRTNPDPRTDPWIITGAMRVNRFLSKAEVDKLVRAAGREPQKVQGEEKKNLPGGLPLLDGYVQNEFGHGEIANLLKLADFLEGEPIAAVADNSVNMPKSLSEITDVAADVGQQLGVGYVEVPGVGKVGVNVRGIKDSMNPFMKNRRTSDAHKQRACDALLLVKDVLQKGKLIDYGLEESKKLVSYLITAPVIVGANQCVMVVRVRKAAGLDGNFYLHGIDLLEQVKEKSRKERQNRGAGLDTGKPDGADPRDVFRVIRKSFSVKYKQQNEFSFSMERNLAAGIR